MRILVYFGARLLENRGTPSRVRNLALALADLPGCDVTVVSGDPPGALGERLGLDHRGLPAGGDRTRGLAAAVDELRPDAVHGHTHKALPALAALDGPLRVADLHGHSAFEKLERRDQGLPRRLAGCLRHLVLERRLVPRIDALTVVSTALSERFAGSRLPRLLLWGGVDPALFAGGGDGASADGIVRVGYAGNFRPYQGIEVLGEAARRALAEDGRFHFDLIGDAAGQPGVVARLRRSLGDRLTLHGEVDYQRVPELLARAQVLVIPRPISRTARFGFPSKLPEYLAMGKAVVATRVGEVERVVSHGENGWLIRPDDPGELAAALLALRQLELRRRIGQGARRRAEELSWERQAERLRAFLAHRIGAADGSDTRPRTAVGAAGG